MGGSKQQQAPKLVNNHTPGRARGTVQHVYPERGFGFIRCTEGGADDVGVDFFFHTTGLEGVSMEELLPGSIVEFDSTEVPRGKRAEHVTRG